MTDDISVTLTDAQWADVVAAFTIVGRLDPRGDYAQTEFEVTHQVVEAMKE